MLPPQLKDNGAFASNGYVDTFGLQGDLYVCFYAGALDIAVGSGDDSTPLLLEEADSSGFSDASDVTGSDMAAVIGATDDNKIYAIRYDLRKAHKRFVRPKAPTAGDGSTGAPTCASGGSVPSRAWVPRTPPRWTSKNWSKFSSRPNTEESQDPAAK